MTPKETLVEYLQTARDAIVWKLDGLTERQIRWPMTPTGTNLLGLVKHLASVELGYFGDTFGRPSGIELPWQAVDAEPNADMWATEDESRDDIVGLYQTAWAHAAKTFEELELDDEGSVPWWPQGNRVTLHQILVHMTTETYQHAGHVDIVRELIDGAAGVRADNSNLADLPDWEAYVARLKRVAESFGD
jgi:hypothetical protein